MFDFFGKKSVRSAPPPMPDLPFKDAQGAFEYACMCMKCELRQGAGNIAIVQDSKALFGASVSVKRKSNGVQLATLKVAAQDGGFLVPAETSTDIASDLNVGDLVLWMAGQHVPNMAQAMGDVRSGWVGLIVARMLPIIDGATMQFKVKENFMELGYRK
jgi:hypothetical protein